MFSISQSIFIYIRQPEPIEARPILIKRKKSTHNTVQNFIGLLPVFLLNLFICCLRVGFLIVCVFCVFFLRAVVSLVVSTSATDSSM